MERGAGRPAVERIPYILEHAVELLKEFRQLILVGAQTPVPYFASPGNDGVLTSPDCEVFKMAGATANAAIGTAAFCAGISGNPQSCRVARRGS